MAMKTWEEIRAARHDLTDYVVHLTQKKPNKTGVESLLQILRSQAVLPTFGRKPLYGRTTTSITVKGPYPAVCLTEQTIAAIVKTLPIIGSRYCGYGIAYHKVHLRQFGGGPVFYATEAVLGRKICKGEEGWEEGKEIYTGGLRPEHQYLFVRYEPEMPGSGSYPSDWTWEREWRVGREGCFAGGLPLLLSCDWQNPPRGAIIVERDEDIPPVIACLDDIAQRGFEWASRLRRVVSLETAQRKLAPPDNDARYARLETWPF
jgi:hypothetical protein